MKSQSHIQVRGLPSMNVISNRLNKYVRKHDLREGPK